MRRAAGAFLTIVTADALCAVGLGGALATARGVGAAILVAAALGMTGLVVRRALAFFEGRRVGLGAATRAGTGRAAVCVLTALAADGRLTPALLLGALAHFSYTLGVRSWARRGGLYVGPLRDGVALLDAALLLAARRPGLAACALACFIAARWLARAEPAG